MSRGRRDNERRDPGGAHAVWDWRTRDLDTIQRRAAARSADLRRTATRLLVGALAAALLWYLGRHRLATVVFAVGLTFFLTALLAPALHRPMERALMTLVGWIMRALTLVLVGLMLYLVLTPLGWLLRASGRLRISLRAAAGASTSTWRDVPATGVDSYRRLF